MATGIKITKAQYGAGSKTVDVRAAVSSNIKNGDLNLVVSPDSLGVPDPAPGQTKQLTMSYTINNGDVNVKSAYDNEVIAISAPSQTIASGIDILKAQYGYPGNLTDVTNAIRNYLKDGSISLKVSHSSVGLSSDPNPNKQKSLEVDYTLNGGKNTAVINDGQMFSISAPVAENPTSGPSIGEVITNFVLSILSYSAYFIAIFASYKYGQLFNKWISYLFAGISLIPGGFVFVCFFAMFYQYYLGSKMNLFQNVVIPFKESSPIITQ